MALKNFFAKVWPVSNSEGSYIKNNNSESQSNLLNKGNYA